MSLFFDLNEDYPNEGSSPSMVALGPYLGFDALAAKHNMRERIAEAFKRGGQLVESATGVRTFEDHAGLPLPVRTFQWTAPDRAACNDLLAFLDARKGRAVPFWVPTCCWDLVLKQDHPTSTTALVLERSGYADFYWPQPSRRYIAIAAPGGTLLRKVTDAVLVDESTEQVTIDTGTGVALAADTAISYLVLCRLAEDFTKLRWLRPWCCEATINFVELPREVPA